MSTPPAASARGHSGAAAGGSQRVAKFTLREMRVADYDRVHALWSSTEGLGMNDSDTRPAIESFLARNPGLSRLAEDPSSGELLGAVLCGHDGRRGYLHHLAVLRHHRRKGVGHALVEACLADLRALRIVKCNIFLFTDNHAGREFWEHAGWKGRDEIVIIQKVL